MSLVTNTSHVKPKMFFALATVAFFSSSAFAQSELPPLPPGVSGPIAPPPPYVWPGIDGYTPEPLRYMMIDGRKYAADQIIVKFKDGIAEGLIANLIASSGLQQKMHIRSLGARLLTFPGPLDARYFLGVLRSNPLVEYANLNGEVGLAQADPPPVLDPYYGKQWNLSQIDITPVWSYGAGTTGTGVRIGILDTGVDSHQPDLTSKIARVQNGNTSTIIGYPPGGDTEDQNGHGTFSASIAAAQTTFSNDTSPAKMTLHPR